MEQQYTIEPDIAAIDEVMKALGLVLEQGEKGGELYVPDGDLPRCVGVLVNALAMVAAVADPKMSDARQRRGFGAFVGRAVAETIEGIVTDRDFSAVDVRRQ